MKKMVACMLVLLLLTGCAAPQTPQTEPSAPAASTESTPVGLYVPDSQAEKETNGAVRSYDLGATGYYAMASLGEYLLLLSGEGETRLSVFSGPECIPVTELILPLDLRENAWQITDSGIAWYDAQSRQAVYLDALLQEQHRVDMPEELEGKPVFAPDGSEIFYCAGQEIRGLDTQRRISRLIKSQVCKSQGLLDIAFGGRVLVCAVESQTGELATLYVSSEDGTTLSSDDGIITLETYHTGYMVHRMDGTTTQYITGEMTGTPTQWNVPEKLVSALSINGLVGYHSDGSGGLNLSFYEISSGRRTAAVTLSNTNAPVAICTDPRSGVLWLLREGESAQTLLRWDIGLSAVNEDAVFTGPVYTASAPDEAGLAALQQRVDALNDQYAVGLRIWQAAVEITGGHQLEAEYQVPAITQMLDQLEPILKLFPESFLGRIGKKSRICLVRSADGTDEPIRYWENGGACIVLPVGTEPEQELLLGLSYLVDSYILGNSPLLDGWEALNPEGFAYGEACDTAYLEGQTQAFVDEAATKTISEDRARIFWMSLQPANAQIFDSPTMQAKLSLLCRAIRDAWHLEQETQPLRWEQYLADPITYTE